MPTNKELELKRAEKLDELDNKVNELLEITKLIYLNTQREVKKPTSLKGKSNARKTSKSF